jgi:AcrR family transcriptional regulator
MQNARSPRRRSDDTRRAELIEAARTVIARDGVREATTRRITQEAGLPHGAFHYWFSNKEELFEELVGDVLKDLKGTTTTAETRPDGTKPGLADLMQAAFGVVRRDEQERPGRQLALYELTTLALRTPTLRELARRQYQEYRELTEILTREWFAEHGANFPGDQDTFINLVSTLFDGVTLAWLANPEKTNPEEVFALLEAIVSRATRP